MSRSLNPTRPVSRRLTLLCEARITFPASSSEIRLASRNRLSCAPSRILSTVGPPLPGAAIRLLTEPSSVPAVATTRPPRNARATKSTSGVSHGHRPFGYKRGLSSSRMPKTPCPAGRAECDPVFTDASPGMRLRIVEVAIPGAKQKGIPLGSGENQRGTVGVPGVTYRYTAGRQPGRLDAVPARVAVAALPPSRPAQPRCLYPVVSNVHHKSLRSGDRVRQGT